MRQSQPIHFTSDRKDLRMHLRTDLPFRDEPLIPALYVLSPLVPILWIAAAAPGGIDGEHAIHILGLGIALGLTAAGLHGLRIAMGTPSNSAPAVAGMIRLTSMLVMIASACLVAIGGSFSFVMLALAVFGPA